MVLGVCVNGDRFFSQVVGIQPGVAANCGCDVTELLVILRVQCTSRPSTKIHPV
jgi:hypothetical protein